MTGKPYRLDGVALVVGAGGLGSAIAAGLAEAGARVVVADLDQRRAERAAQAAGGEACRIDVTDGADVQDAVDGVLHSTGRIDVLVNAAGITQLGPAETYPEDAWHRILAVNLTGVFLVSQAVGRHMLARGSGAIVNLSSIAGSVGLTDTIAYCASKGGVEQVTRAMAVEWARRGVRVNAVAPSWFATDMGALLDSRPGLHDERLGRVPAGRIGDPRELVGAVVFLASPAASMVTGAVLPVDGGYLAQ
jgi:NAD(P)-dependent dehydrogenase (short-subunit alcohol dehydrogenase family)